MNTWRLRIGRRIHTFERMKISATREGVAGAYGFNTETSMGPAVPPIESVERMVPKDHLWTVGRAAG